MAIVRRDRWLALIIGYKLGKAGLWFVLAAALAVGAHMGLEPRLAGLADDFRHHATHAWSIALGRLVLHAATPRGLWTLVVALVADGVMSLVEGWALWHGHWWGPWLVVVATGSLLPYEGFAFARHAHVGRALLFLINLSIVVYLARRALLERAAHGPSTPSPVRPAR
jgi:uncharacterized membrane protein (DUF2068 family)